MRNAYFLITALVIASAMTSQAKPRRNATPAFSHVGKWEGSVGEWSISLDRTRKGRVELSAPWTSFAGAGIYKGNQLHVRTKNKWGEPSTYIFTPHEKGRILALQWWTPGKTRETGRLYRVWSD